MIERTPRLFVMNQEEGNLYPLDDAIWDDSELYRLVEEYLNNQTCTIAHLEY